MEKLLKNYQNGNYIVLIFEEGTKIRFSKGDGFNPLFPESIDLKITNYCDAGCRYCHEESTVKGQHCEINELMDILSELPAGVELALGGGNPLSHPRLNDLLLFNKSKGFITNITVNQYHINEDNILRLKDLTERKCLHGIGISITNEENIDSLLEKINLINSKNIVFHLICGINNIEILNKLKSKKVLILGYKIFGRGKYYFNENIKLNIEKWKNEIINYFDRCLLTFDNLAINQLNLKNLLSEQEWNTYYMGDDFEFTMYIDAVKKEFGESSTSNKRISWTEKSITNFFKK